MAKKRDQRGMIDRLAAAAFSFSEYLAAGELITPRRSRRFSRAELLKKTNEFERVYRLGSRQLPGRCHAIIDSIFSGIRSEIRDDERGGGFIELGVYCVDRVRIAYDLLTSYSAQLQSGVLQVGPRASQEGD